MHTLRILQTDDEQQTFALISPAGPRVVVVLDTMTKEDLALHEAARAMYERLLADGYDAAVERDARWQQMQETYEREAKRNEMSALDDAIAAKRAEAAAEGVKP